jgi:signal peptidase II
VKRFCTSPLFFALLALTMAALDRLSKFLVQCSVPLAQVRPFIGTFICITHAHNPGGAFSLFPQMSIIFKIMGFLVPILIVIFLKKIIQKGAVWVTAAALLLGGALGNLIDRIMLGYVIDFIDIRVGGRNVWPIFNVADIAISVGVGLLFIVLLREGHDEEKDGKGSGTL